MRSKNNPRAQMGRGFWLTVVVALAILAVVAVIGAYYANGRWGVQ